jgi:hypothetical protein
MNTSPMNPPCHIQATRRLIGVVVLALLCAQWAALSHAIAHADRSAMAARLATAASADDHDHGGEAWGHDAGTPTCQLLDHLLAGHAAGGEPPPLFLPRPAAVLLAAPALSITPGPASRAYEARGPPRA